MFENGQLMREYSFDEVRDRAELPLVKKRRKEEHVSETPLLRQTESIATTLTSLHSSE